MNTKVNTISEKELMKKVEEGVSGTAVWQKPLLLLTKNGDDHNYISDLLHKNFRDKYIESEPSFDEFVRVDNKLEMTLNGVIVDYHFPDVDLYKYQRGPMAFDEKVCSYCVNLIEYEGKPVISFICVADKDCAIEDIPEWMEDEFEIAMFL